MFKKYSLVYTLAIRFARGSMSKEEFIKEFNRINEISTIRGSK
jgi:hypothetical protein